MPAKCLTHYWTLNCGGLLELYRDGFRNLTKRALKGPLEAWPLRLNGSEPHQPAWGHGGCTTASVVEGVD
jgi:hypothetical protein